MPPQIGLADSADFGRITSRLGLSQIVENPEDRFFNFFNPGYHIVDSPKIPINIGQVFGVISLGLSKISQSDSYSIFYLSSIYFILYTCGFYLFLKNAFKYLEGANKGKIFLGFLSIIVLSDIMFTSYFNSFYQEAVFIIAALFAVALIIEPKIRYNWILIVLLILSLSKSQNILFLIFPVLLIIWKFKQFNKLVLSISFFTLSFFLFFILKEQINTNGPNLYEAVFLGLMTTASQDSQEKILQDLGLEEEGYLINVNKEYWRPHNELVENKRLSTEFYTEVTQGKIIKVYLKHPTLFFKTAWAGIEVLFENSAQPAHLGNYSKKFSIREQKTVFKSIWGKYLNLFFIPIYLTGFVIVGLSCLKNIKNKMFFSRLESYMIVLVIWIPLLYSAIFVAGGINDFVKHNLPVYFLISILFLILWIFILRTAEKPLTLIKTSKFES